MESAKIILGMAGLTVVSATAQMILRALGKRDESILLDFTTKCLMIATGATAFTSVAKALLGVIV